METFYNISAFTILGLFLLFVVVCILQEIGIKTCLKLLVLSFSILLVIASILRIVYIIIN